MIPYPGVRRIQVSHGGRTHSRYSSLGWLDIFFYADLSDFLWSNTHRGITELDPRVLEVVGDFRRTKDFSFWSGQDRSDRSDGPV